VNVQMRIEVRSLNVSNSIPTDYAQVYIPYGQDWVAWCGTSFIYPPAGLTNPSYVVADIYREKKESDTIVPQLWEQLKAPWAWGGLFLEQGHILNPRKPIAWGKTDVISHFSGKGMGTTLYFRLYTFTFGTPGLRAGAFGVVLYF
jgi:hypothetical protein